MAARAFEAAAPFDIVLLIESCFEFYENIYLLAVFGGFNKAFHYLAVACKTVKRHFYGYNARIMRSFIQHHKERANALIRIMEHLIPLLYLIEYRT